MGKKRQKRAQAKKLKAEFALYIMQPGHSAGLQRHNMQRDALKSVPLHIVPLYGGVCGLRPLTWLEPALPAPARGRQLPAKRPNERRPPQ